MFVKKQKKYKINVVTLGCSKNMVDSEVLIHQLNENDFTVIKEEAEHTSNAVIINTCGFIEQAKEQSIDAILQYSDLKKDNQLDKLYVTGCLSERYKDDLSKSIDGIDGWFGTMEMPSLLNALGADYKKNLIGERTSLLTPNHYAYLKISEGCDRPCSFCAIPLMRGKHVSRTIESLVKEATFLTKRGVKEIMLIAQDSTFYGLDIYKKRSLNDLLIELTKVQGLERVRIHYAYPSKFPMEVLDTMAADNNICKYIDIPVQHITDDVLKSMRRGITKKRTIDLLNTIREKVPGIGIRTTLLVGHPGETIKDFEELKEFVADFKFDRLGVFTYSHEEDTHAYTLADDIPEEEKQRRANEIMEIQEEISFEINQNKIGNTYDVLIDRLEDGLWIGRTEFDSPEVDNEVIVEFDPSIELGQLIKVKINDAQEFDLMGSLVK